MNEQAEPLEFDAWAHGSALPAAIAFSGVSASAWAVRPKGCAAAPKPEAKASTTSNRNAWQAGIMAVVGVLEVLPPRARVALYLRDKVLGGAIGSSFISTKGAPMEDQDLWSRVEALRTEKQIRLSVSVLNKGSGDAVMKAVEEAGRATACRRSQELGVEKAVADAKGPKLSASRSKWGFPPVAEPIKRKGPPGLKQDIKRMEAEAHRREEEEAETLRKRAGERNP